jgi:hypothetical protein
MIKFIIYQRIESIHNIHYAVLYRYMKIIEECQIYKMETFCKINNKLLKYVWIYLKILIKHQILYQTVTSIIKNKTRILRNKNISIDKNCIYCIK